MLSKDAQDAIGEVIEGYGVDVFREMVNYGQYIYEIDTSFVNEYHLKLVDEAYWNTDARGKPILNSKRPYGNSDIYSDIRKITELYALSEDCCEKLHKGVEEIFKAYTFTALEMLGKPIDKIFEYSKSI